MSDYRSAIHLVLTSEGFKVGRNMGYAIIPNDNGGETIAGIARNYWQKHPIWAIVDAAKQQPNFPKNLVSNTKLFDLIINFYEVNFWDRIFGDNIKNQTIANMLVDRAVNEGIVAAVKRAEEIVGLNQTGKISDVLILKLNLLQ